MLLQLNIEPASLQTWVLNCDAVMFAVCAWPVMIRRPACVAAVCSTCCAKKTIAVSRIAISSAMKGVATSANSTAVAPSSVRTKRRTRAGV